MILPHAPVGAKPTREVIHINRALACQVDYVSRSHVDVTGDRLEPGFYWLTFHEPYDLVGPFATREAAEADSWKQLFYDGEDDAPDTHVSLGVEPLGAA